MTLIAVYDSGGCAGRCDARCYAATGGDCDCICGGLNHGVGLHRALEQTTRAVAEQLVDGLGRPFDQVELAPELGQARLPLEPPLSQGAGARSPGGT